MKIISINDAPSIRDRYSIMRKDVTDLTKIVDGIDTAEGRNDALRAYIYALRDLQHEHDTFSYENNYAAIDAAQARVIVAFNRLIEAQHRLDDELIQPTLRKHFGP
jgi:hypothetical protein